MAHLTGIRQILWTEENLSGVLMLVVGLVTLPVHAKILVMMLIQPSSYSWLHWWPVVLIASGLAVLISEVRFQKRLKN
ncbi:MAG: hypothetical protein ROO76_11900 [Terriglobia bacterium]|nr:hypothetical protein [Terriglobia bacterium]